jgi:hypothetical protein
VTRSRRRRSQLETSAFGRSDRACSVSKRQFHSRSRPVSFQASRLASADPPTRFQPDAKGPRLGRFMLAFHGWPPLGRTARSRRRSQYRSAARPSRFPSAAPLRLPSRMLTHAARHVKGSFVLPAAPRASSPLQRVPGPRPRPARWRIGAVSGSAAELSVNRRDLIVRRAGRCVFRSDQGGRPVLERAHERGLAELESVLGDLGVHPLPEQR